MQNNIYNFAIRSNEIDKIVLCEMCDEMEPGIRDRFVNAILGIVNVDELVASIPEETTGRDGIRIFVDYNYLQDKLWYKYRETVKRWFADKELAEKYEKTGDYPYGKSSYKQEGEYTIEASHVFDRESYCQLSDWNNK